jgi:hypothetical protein
MDSPQLRKTEQIAHRIETSLTRFEFILIPLIIVGCILVYTDKPAMGIPISFGAAMILAIVYFFRWFNPGVQNAMQGFLFKLTSFTLAIGTLGIIFSLLHMKTGKMFLIICIADTLVSTGFWLIFRKKIPETELIRRDDMIRLAIVLAICVVLLSIKLPVPEVFQQPVVIE